MTNDETDAPKHRGRLAGAVAAVVLAVTGLGVLGAAVPAAAGSSCGFDSHYCVWDTDGLSGVEAEGTGSMYLSSGTWRCNLVGSVEDRASDGHGVGVQIRVRRNDGTYGYDYVYNFDGNGRSRSFDRTYTYRVSEIDVREFLTEDGEIFQSGSYVRACDI